MHFHTTLLVALLTLIIVSPVLAEATADPYRQPNLMELNEEQAARLTPMLQQIRGVLAVHLDEMAVLETKIEASGVPTDVHTLERQVADAKLAVEIRILEIQADFARNEGRTTEAKQFSNLAETLRHPAPRQAIAAAPERQEVSR